MTEALDQVSTEKTDIYRCRLPEGLWALLLVQPADIYDGIPTEVVIAVVVRGLKVGRTGFPLVMSAEGLKGWL